MQKRYRLLRKVDFKKILRSNRKVVTSNFVCYFVLDGSPSNVQIGIIIPKKKCKLAVRRKYFKRVFWSLSTRAELPNFPKIKCVFFFRNGFFCGYDQGILDYRKLKSDFLSTMFQLEELLNACR